MKTTHNFLRPKREHLVVQVFVVRINGGNEAVIIVRRAVEMLFQVAVLSGKVEAFGVRRRDSDALSFIRRRGVQPRRESRSNLASEIKLRTEKRM